MNRTDAYGMFETFPHCDSAVLHAPGECEYCDRHPDWQALRLVWGIAFTGHAPTDVDPTYAQAGRQLPCPSDARRGIGQAHTWGGNRPTNVDPAQLPEETFNSRVMYGSTSVNPWEWNP